MEEITREKVELLKKEREKERLVMSYDYSKYKTKFLDNVLE
jgi:hypothetical protein